MNEFIQKTLINRLLSFFKITDTRLLKRLSMLVGIFSILFVLIAIDFSPKAITGLEVSKPSPETIRAPRAITLLDVGKTLELRKQAAESISTVFRFNEAVPAKVRSRVKAFYQKLGAALAKEDVDEGERRKTVSKLLPETADQLDLDWILSLDQERVSGLERKTLDLAMSVITEKINEEQLGAKQAEVKRRAMADDDPQAGRLIGAIATNNIKANTFVDTKKTNAAISEAVDKVESVYVQKLSGETIVTEGQIVTSFQEQFLKELGLAESLGGSSNSQVVGQGLIAFGLIVLGLIYLYEFQPKVYSDNRLLMLVFVILATVSALAKGLAPLLSPYMIPAAGAAMLTTILIRARAGVMMAITTGLVTGLIVDSPEYWLFAFMTGLFAVYLTAHISHRSDLTKAGLWIMFASGLTAYATSLVHGDVGFSLLINAGWGLLGGFVAIIFTIGTLQFLEYAFNITTDMKLLELSNPNQPLLRELMVNAPGTYNHSIITGNLVESVALKVGANPLLARTGAYYHDIGKMRRPFFFIENQYGDNPHDKTQSNLSYLIITSHVKDGVAMAKKNRLPNEIIDIINQHHGTTLMTYFYSRALKEDPNSTVLEAQFRYHCEKPKSREAALIMLADAVEATARTLEKPTLNRVEHMVKKLIKDRLVDGQLDESDLTLAQLETTAKVFAQTLTTMYHTRIEYPEIEPTSKKDKEALIGRPGGKSIRRSNKAIGS